MMNVELDYEQGWNLVDDAGYSVGPNGVWLYKSTPTSFYVRFSLDGSTELINSFEPGYEHDVLPASSDIESCVKFGMTLIDEFKEA